MTARVIAITAAKGGVGKTTIATALAVYGARSGDTIAMVDAEPQQSLGLWWERRGEPDNPKAFTAEDDKDVARTIARLKGGAWDWVIIDSPPAIVERIDAVVKAADFVLIPVRPSIFDVEAISPVTELCKEHRKRFAFVMSHADPKWKLLAATIDALGDYGPVLAEQVRYRAAYASAVTIGKTGPESGDRSAVQAKEEIAALWRAVKKLAKAG